MDLSNNTFKYVGSGLIGSLLGAGVSLKISRALSKKELEKLKQLSSLFKLRIERNPKLKKDFEILNLELDSINSLPYGPELSERKIEFLKMSNKFLKSLNPKDRKIYTEIQKIMENISEIKLNSGKIGFFLGGIIGILIGDKL